MRKQININRLPNKSSQSLAAVVKLATKSCNPADADQIAASGCVVKRKEPLSTADNDSTEWAMTGSNRRHPRCKRANVAPEDLTAKELVAMLFAACTSACTRFQETVKSDPLDVLADELRQTLTPDELRRLAEILSATKSEGKAQ